MSLARWCPAVPPRRTLSLPPRSTPERGASRDAHPLGSRHCCPRAPGVESPMLSMRSPRAPARCSTSGAHSSTFLRLPLRHPSLAVASGSRRSQRIDWLHTRHRCTRRGFPGSTAGTDLPRRLTDVIRPITLPLSRSRRAIHSGRSPPPCAPTPMMRTSTPRGGQSTRPTPNRSTTHLSSTPDRHSPSPRTYHEHPNRAPASRLRGPQTTDQHEAPPPPAAPAPPAPGESGS